MGPASAEHPMDESMDGLATVNPPQTSLNNLLPILHYKDSLKTSEAQARNMHAGMMQQLQETRHKSNFISVQTLPQVYFSASGATPVDETLFSRSPKSPLSSHSTSSLSSVRTPSPEQREHPQASDQVSVQILKLLVQ